MVIDFHVHTFPEKIAPRALHKLSKSGDTIYYSNGTLADLQISMKKSDISHSVLLPVATSPMQHETINRTAIEINSHAEETGIYSFGGIHPDNNNYREIIKNLSANGVKGIKLHPVFQNVYLDDIRYLRIIEAACEQGMIILSHAGYDINFAEQDYAAPKHIRAMIDQIHPDKLVLAHMGGWNCWDEVEELLVGQEVWFDTSFSITPIRSPQKTNIGETIPLSPEQFRRIVSNHGIHHILFGSDSPWSDQKEALEVLSQIGLEPTQLSLILSENAKRLLGQSS